jgi:hypothetical protein
MDGMTYNATIDTSTGFFELFELDEDGESNLPPPKPKNNNFNEINKEEKELLKNKFFELKQTLS